MPYTTVDQLPAQFAKYGPKGRKAALQAFNNAYAEYKGNEARAFATAHMAAKRAEMKLVKKARGKSLGRGR